MASVRLVGVPVPFERHGNGATAFYYALMAGERGEVAEFDVVNVDDWSRSGPAGVPNDPGPAAQHSALTMPFMDLLAGKAGDGTSTMLTSRFD